MTRRAAAWALRTKARDQTAEIARRSCLVLAPHPDDESLGCGGVIALKRSEGTEVTVVIATAGGSGQPVELIDPDDLAAVRRSEAVTACSILGVPEDRLVFWGFPTKQLTMHREDAERRLIELVRTHRPDEVYVTSALDDNRDHRALNQIAVAALSQADIDVILLEYPVWFWVTMPWFPHIETSAGRFGRALLQPLAMLWSLRPLAVNIRPVMNLKNAAIDAHRSQVRGLDDDPRWKNLPGPLLQKVRTPRELFFPVDHRPKVLTETANSGNANHRPMAIDTDLRPPPGVAE